MIELGLSQNSAIIGTLPQLKSTFKSDADKGGTTDVLHTIQESPSDAEGMSIYENDVSPSGLKIMRAAGFVKVPGSPGSKALFVPHRPYDEAVHLVAKFCSQRKRSKIAWIFHARSMFVPYPPGLESRGLDISNMLFVETSTPERALKTICDELFFESIIFDHHITQSALHIVRKWLKPPQRPLLGKADAFQEQRADRLVVLIE